MNKRTLVFFAMVILTVNFSVAIAQQEDVMIHHEMDQFGAEPFEMPVPPPGSFLFISSLSEMGDKVVKGAPYSAKAVTERIQTLGDGNRIVRKNTSQVYRDSEGRIRREQEFGMIGNLVSAERPERSIFINDPVSGNHYVLNPEEQTAVRLKPEKVEFREKGERGVFIEKEEILGPPVPVPGPGFRERIRFKSKPENTRNESLGKQMMEGVEVEGSRKVTVIPEGEIGNEREIEMINEKWYSPELKLYVMTRHSDPRFGETTYRLTNIKKGDPDPSLFQVPEVYKITEKSQPQIKFRKKLE